jgi:hypothetical protein
MNYLDEVMSTLQTQYRVTDSQALEYIRAELLRSWKNGVERGQRRAEGPEGTTRARRRQ